MKKQNRIKLALSKKTVSKLDSEIATVKGGISGGACVPIKTVPVTLGCAPFSAVRTNCCLTYQLSCICG